MALINLTTLDRGGVATAGGAAATVTTGDTFPNSGNELLQVKNGSGAQITVSVTVQRKVDGQTPPPKTFTVAAGETVISGPWPEKDYTDPQTGLATVVCSAVGSVTLKALRPVQQ